MPRERASFVAAGMRSSQPTNTRTTTTDRAESADSGKPLKLALNVDIPRAVHNLRFFAGLAPNAPQVSPRGARHYCRGWAA